MRRSVGIYVLTVAVLTPLVWLAATTPVFGGGRALALFGGAVVTAGVLLHIAWRAHRAGSLFPHLCGTCEHPMTRIQPGELRPPEGAGGPTARRWRCRHCGRLA